MKKLLSAILLFILCFTVCLVGSKQAWAEPSAAHKTIVKVGWFETNSNATPDKALDAHGYDYEYLQALSQYTHWEYQYVPGTWDECLTRLANGEIDLVGFVRKTKERETIFAFPQLPMGITNAWLVIDKNNQTIKAADKSSLDGKKIGLVKGNSFNGFLHTYCDSIDCKPEYIEYSSLADIAPALTSGSIDAAVVADEDLTANERCLHKLASESYYFATNPRNTQLLQELNAALVQLNTYYPYLNGDLYQKYFGRANDGKPSFTTAEVAFIAAHPNIVVKYDSGWPPIEYYDNEKQEYAGISPDLFKLLSKKCGINFVYEGSTSGQVLTDLGADKDVNVVTTISYDYNWADKHNVYITQPFVTSAIVKLGKNINAEHPTVAINEKAYFTYLMRDELQNVKTLHFAKQAERLEAVNSGLADYTYVTEDQANYYCSMPKYSDLQKSKILDKEQKICISISKNSDPLLFGIISKSLAGISHDEMTGIIINNTTNAYTLTFGDILLKYRIPLLIVAIFLLTIISGLVAMNTLKRKNEIKLLAAYAKEQEAHEKETEALNLAKKASAAKGDFMSRMSHEIRTPLNAVIGYNTIARNELSKAKTIEEHRRADMKIMDYLSKSELASKHLLTIINDVLDMSSIESGKIKVCNEQFDFKNLISALTVLFFSQAKSKGVEFEVLFNSPTEEWFIGDSMRINQILTNLLSNAVKFTPTGGSVKLIVNHTLVNENQTLFHFVVEDTGIGMAPEYLEHIWTPFEQAEASISRRFGGTGLGMSITKSLVDLMGGRIKVSSKYGEGSTFTVDLTLGRVKQPEKTGGYDFADINALVVDDDASTCDYIKLLFERCSARCMTVTSGRQALDAFEEARKTDNHYTLCLIDWRMPDMDGIETVKAVRKIAGDELPIIIVTAYDFSEIAQDAEEAGVNMFLSKPLFQSSLFDLLANISGKRLPISPNTNSRFNFTNYKVLLAEDNKMNMEVAKQILESSGLQVDCAWDGSEAIEKFTKAPAGTYQAILMDVHMPVVDGHQACRTIRSSEHPEAKTIPIIAMTADAFAENVAEAYDAGMDDHISKPIDISTLFETLAKHLPKKAQ